MSIENLATISDTESKLIGAVWQAVVASGKYSKKLKKYADAEGKKGPKYRDPNNMARTGACAAHECEVLYRLAKSCNPWVALDIGTWFGTTAYTLAQVCPVVYTCDKHDLIVASPKTPFVRQPIFYHGPSTKFWKKLARKGVKTQFVWADASLRVGDIERMLPLFDGPIRFAVHDYEDGEKGWRNMKALGQVLGKQIVPEVEGIIAFYGE